MLQFAIWLLREANELRWNDEDRLQFWREQDIGLVTIMVEQLQLLPQRKYLVELQHTSNVMCLCLSSSCSEVNTTLGA